MYIVCILVLWSLLLRYLSVVHAEIDDPVSDWFNIFIDIDLLVSVILIILNQAVEMNKETNCLQSYSLYKLLYFVFVFWAYCVYTLYI